MRTKKRGLSLFITLCLIVGMLPQTAFATQGVQDSGATIGASGLCEHHTAHDETCGYVEAAEGTPCTHEHSEDCYEITESCTHTHSEDCYPVLDSGVSGNEAAPSDAAQPTCGHECSEESGCITEGLNCTHTHDDLCGYIAAVEGHDCHYGCVECTEEPETPTTQVCTCEVAEGQAHAEDCALYEAPADPTCTCEVAEGEAHVKDCVLYEAPADSTCTCETKCAEDAINTDCAICSTEGADLSACTGKEASAAPVCDCGTDDEAIHATTCGVYVAPENPLCYCVEKCTEVNIWCDVCGFDLSKCTGAKMAVRYASTKNNAIAWTDTDGDGVQDGGEPTWDCLSDALEEGGTVRLLGDTDLPEHYTLAEKYHYIKMSKGEAVLDLNGYTLHFLYFDVGDYKSMTFGLSGTADLTVTDSKNSGKILIDDYDKMDVSLKDTAKLTFAGGLVDSGYAPLSFSLNITKDDSAKFVIAGGTYSSNPSQWVSPGFKTEEGTLNYSRVWTVSPITDSETLLWDDANDNGSIDDDERRFDSLPDAGSAGDNLKLYRDITHRNTGADRFLITKDCTIDLNGYTLTVTNGTALDINGRGINVTVKDSKGGGEIITEAGYAAIMASKANVTVESGLYRGDLFVGGTLTVEGGTIHGILNGNVQVYGGTIHGSLNGNVQVYGGEYSSDPSEYVADGYAADKKEDGMWGIWPDGAAHCDITLDPTEHLHTGQAITSNVTVTVTQSGSSLTQGEDYTVAYTDNVDVGTATVTVTFIKDYRGAVTKNFTIYEQTQTQLPDITISESYTYNGEAQKPDIKFSYGGPLTEGTDYTVKYLRGDTVTEDFISAGVITVEVTGIGNYRGIRTKTYTILRKAIGSYDHSVSIVPETVTYDGTEKIPDIKILYNATELVVGRDYYMAAEQSGFDYINAGTTIFSFVGMGNYQGTWKPREWNNNISYTIEPKALSDTDVTVSPNTVWNDNAQIPEVTVTGVLESDYTVTYTRDGKATSDFTDCGAITITVAPKSGNCTGSVTKEYVIAHAPDWSCGHAPLKYQAPGSEQVEYTDDVSYLEKEGTITLLNNITVDSYLEVGNATIVMDGYSITLASEGPHGGPTGLVSRKGALTIDASAGGSFRRAEPATGFVRLIQLEKALEIIGNLVFDTNTGIRCTSSSETLDLSQYTGDGLLIYNESYGTTFTPTLPSGYEVVSWTSADGPTDTVYDGNTIPKRTYGMVKAPHTHSWSYELDGTNRNTIKATCTAADCPETGAKTIVISASDKVYDGTAVTATVTNHVDSTDYSASIVYEAKTGTLTEGRAVNAGTYTAKITVGGATASVDFTISQIPLTIQAKDQSIAYGQNIAAGTDQVTATGLVGGDTLTGVTLTPGISDVGTGIITPSAAEVSSLASNYNITYQTGTLIITQAAAQSLAETLYVANNRAGTYTLDLSGITPTSGSWGSNPAVSFALGTVSLDQNYYDSGADVAKGRLTLPIKAHTTDVEGSIGTVAVTITSQNFAKSTLTVTVMATNKTPVTIQGVTPATGLVYNGAAQQGYTGSPTNAQGYTGGYAFGYADAQGNPLTQAPTDAGSYTVTISVPSSSGTHIGSLTLQFQIAKKQLSWGAGTAVISQAYVPDRVAVVDTSSLTPDSVALSGVVAGDDVGWRGTVQSASFADDSIGTGKPVAVALSSLVLTGADAHNYLAPTGTLTITGDITAPNTGNEEVEVLDRFIVTKDANLPNDASYYGHTAGPALDQKFGTTGKGTMHQIEVHMKKAGADAIAALSGVETANAKTEVLEISLKYWDGDSWEKIDEEHLDDVLQRYPNGVPVTIPYRLFGFTDTANYSNYKFVVQHMITLPTDDRYAIGDIEDLSGNVTATADGLHFNVMHGFSPFVVGFAETKTSQGGNTGDNGGNAGTTSGGGTSYDNDNNDSYTAPTYRNHEEDFWKQVEKTIREAKSDNKIIARARNYDRMPAYVMVALRERGDIMLEIHWNGGDTIIIPAGKALNEPNRIFYPLSYLEDYDFADVQASLEHVDLNTGGGPLEVEAPAIVSIITTPDGKPEITDPRRGLADTMEDAKKGIEKDIPGVFEPETVAPAPDDATESQSKSGGLFAGIALLLAALAVGGGYLYFRKRKEAE